MPQYVICNGVSSGHKKEQTGYDGLMSFQVQDVVDRLSKLALECCFKHIRI